ncbi:MAG: DUF4363 family protein [Bacillota bacterium]
MRTLFAVLLIVLLIGGGVLETIYIDNIFDEFCARLDEISNVENGEYDISKIKETHVWWQKKHQYLELFLPHVQLNEIETTYGELIGAVETEDYDSASALLNRINVTSSALSEMYGFRLGNIF